MRAACLLFVNALPVAMCAGAAGAPPQYTFIDLGTQPGAVCTYAQDINNRGEVVGTSWTAGGATYAFLWKVGEMTDLAAPAGATNPSCVGMDEVRGAVGSVRFGESQHRAVLWQDAIPSYLADCDWGPCGINDSGQIGGTLTTADGYRRACLWQSGELAELGTLGGAESCGIGMNTQAHIVGWAYLEGAEYYHAFIWKDATVSDLDPLGRRYSYATAINPSDQVVGACEFNGLYFEAFLWEHGSMRSLGTLGGVSSRANDINGLGQIVGRSELGVGSGVERAFLWDEGVMYNLDTLVPGHWGKTLVEATAINDLGHIVGYYQDGLSGRQGAFLLLPEPASLAILAFGALRLIGGRRGRQSAGRSGR